MAHHVLASWVSLHLQVVKLIYGDVLLFSIIHLSVSRTLEVNRNASMFTDLLSKIFIPRLAWMIGGWARKGGFMHYVEEADVTLSNHGLDYILKLPPSFPSLKIHLMHLTVFYTTLLMLYMSWAHFIWSSISKEQFNDIGQEAVYDIWPSDLAQADN